MIVKNYSTVVMPLSSALRIWQICQTATDDHYEVLLMLDTIADMTNLGLWTFIVVYGPQDHHNDCA